MGKRHFLDVDYSELKGMELKCVQDTDSGGTWMANDRHSLKAFVADIDFKKGITIKHSYGKHIDVLCVNRKESNFYRAPYEDIFAYVLIAILKGEWRKSECPNTVMETPFVSKKAVCAFQ